MKLNTWGRFNNGDLIIWKLHPNNGRNCPQMWIGYAPECFSSLLKIWR